MIRPRLLIFQFILPVTQLIRDSLEDSKLEATPLVDIERSDTKHCVLDNLAIGKGPNNSLLNNMITFDQFWVQTHTSSPEYQLTRSKVDQNS